MSVAAAAVVFAGACASAPDTEEEQASLEARAESTKAEMIARDPGLQTLLNRASGYVVFPSIGKGGVIVGGAAGTGVVYERGQVIGYAELNQGSIGAQLGGQTFGELMVFGDPNTWQRFLLGEEFSTGGNVSAVAVNKGAAAGANFRSGVGVFVMPKGGLMLDISVAGQTLKFIPAR
jgi:lipid-binding SYLF domain-containing protein